MEVALLICTLRESTIIIRLHLSTCAASVLGETESKPTAQYLIRWSLRLVGNQTAPRRMAGRAASGSQNCPRRSQRLFHR